MGVRCLVTKPEGRKPRDLYCKAKEQWMSPLGSALSQPASKDSVSHTVLRVVRC